MLDDLQWDRKATQYAENLRALEGLVKIFRAEFGGRVVVIERRTKNRKRSAIRQLGESGDEIT